MTELQQERKQQVGLWFQHNPTPIQELCPMLTQYWKNSKGDYVFWDSRSQTRMTDTRHERSHYGRNIHAVRSEYEGFYLHYIPELDGLEIAKILLPGGRGKDGDNKEWKFVSRRWIIFHDDPTTYVYTPWASNPVSASQDGRYYSKSLDTFLRGMNSTCSDRVAYMEFQRYAKGAVISRWGNAIEIPWPWDYAEWYKKNNMSRPNGKKTNSYVECQLDDIEPPPPDCLSDRTAYLVYQKIDDHTAVLRKFEAQGEYRSYKGWRWNRWRESCRVFITDKGKPTTTRPNGNGKWSVATNLGYLGDGKCTLLNYAEAMEWKPLKYILPVIERDLSVEKILILLRHPIVEQLAKAGYPQIASLVMMHGTPVATLKEYFGIEKETKDPLYKMLGVNRYILTLTEQSSYNSWGRSIQLLFVKGLKELYGRFDISDLSEESVREAFSACEEDPQMRLHQWCPQYRSYGYRYHPTLTEEDRVHLRALFKANSKDKRILPLWSDICRTFRSMLNPPDIDLWNTKGYDDLQRLHDDLIALDRTQRENYQIARNAQKAKEIEARKKEFEKLQDDRIAKYERIGNRFAVLVPKALDEIVSEGSYLHHCVGGYVNDHACGYTNILFLRKVNDQKTPFYTIEIRDGRVIQIHGKYNRWLGNDPDAVPFMYAYLKEIGAHFTDDLLLNQGHGYSRGSESLPVTALQASVPIVFS